MDLTMMSKIELGDDVIEEIKRLKNIIYNGGWRRIGNSPNYISFIFNDEPEILHIIKTGFTNSYFVIQENAYQDQHHGKLVFETKESILEKYKINLDEEKF